ncbi:hypothetical protein [Neisseria musculi]|uniref:Uncharacterized protein n=1 Tax=Neisseria musculi TaxID=1815583 RepID=A0A7H1MAQ4_9NEIS|nr:hypothetical protein [Neisseria musculi]QNT58719.1 hypothetical protein H7A79_0375 [Neisseria musculi]
MNRAPQPDLQKRPAGMEILLAETQAGKARAEAHWAAVETQAAQAAVLVYWRFLPCIVTISPVNPVYAV